MIEIGGEDKAEIRRIFNGKEEDIEIGEEVYKLRILKWNKSSIQRVLGISQYKLEQILGTIGFSKYLTYRIESSGIKGSEGEEIPEGIEKMSEEEYNKVLAEKLKKRMMELICQITDVKIWDASLEELANAYNKLYNTYRLSIGESTENKAIAIKDVSIDKYYKELESLSKQIKEIEKSKEKEK